MRLLTGYLLGSLTVSITLGLVIVFVFGSAHSSLVHTSKRTVDPVIDIVVGVLILIVTYIVATGRDRRRRAWSARRKAKRADKPPPKWQRTLGRGTARSTFVVGMVLSLPGASYLAGLLAIDRQHLSTAATVLTVLAFNFIMLTLLEVPLLGFVFNPDWTSRTIARFRAWVNRDGRRILEVAALLVAVVLIARGLRHLLLVG